MSAVLRLVLLLGLAAGAAALAAAEAPAPAAGPELTVASADRTVTFTADEFSALPHSECAVADPHSGRARHLSGVAMRDLLARVDAPLGPKLRGAALGLAVVVRSRDGYKVVFSLADFDDAFRDRALLLADREDGRPLPAAAGPFQLVVPGDKRAARWARMVAAIEIVGVGAPAPAPAAKP